MIKQTQDMWLGSRRVGVDENSGLAMPDLQKIAKAYKNIPKHVEYLTPKEAEILKIYNNSYAALRVVFANIMYEVCGKHEADYNIIKSAYEKTGKTTGKYLDVNENLRGYGGMCLPKDTKALTKIGDKFASNMSVVRSVINSNENRKAKLAEKIIKLAGKNKKIGFLGVTFKANTDDMRDTQCLKIFPKLLKKGFKVSYYDPTGLKKELKKLKYEKSSDDILTNNDLIVIHTEWDEFRSLNFKKIKGRKKVKIFDMRNLYQPEYFLNKKVSYYSIGRPLNEK